MKRRGCLTVLLAIIIIIGAVAGAIAIFLPGFFGPKNLDVKISQTAYESAVTKLEYVMDKASVIDTALTSEELTSYINYKRPESYGLKKVQIRINSDDTLEIAGALDTDYFIDNVLKGKYSREDIKKAVPMIGLLPKSVNIYSKIGVEIVNNQTSNLAVSDIEVMGVGLPDSICNSSKAKTEIGNILNAFIENSTKKTGAIYDSISVQDGVLILLSHQMKGLQ